MIYVYVKIYIHFHPVCCCIVTLIIVCHNVCSPMLFMTKFLTCPIDLFFSLICSKQYFDRTRSYIKFREIYELEEYLVVYLCKNGNMRFSYWTKNQTIFLFFPAHISAIRYSKTFFLHNLVDMYVIFWTQSYPL